MSIWNVQYEPGPGETVTVADEAIGITPAIIRPTSGVYNGRVAEYARIRAETAQMRFREDGTAPTATVGELFQIGDAHYPESIKALDNLKFIRTGAVSGKVFVQPYFPVSYMRAD